MNLRSCLGAALLLAVAAGCGSSSSSRGATSTPSATRPPSPVASPSTPADSSALASVSSSASAIAAAVSSAAPSTTSAAPAAAVGNGSTTDFCKAISTTEGILTTAATSPQDPTLPEMLKRLHTLAASAPSAIRVDLDVIADFDQKIVDGFASGKPPAIDETPELKAAMLHEALWVQKNCS